MREAEGERTMDRYDRLGVSKKPHSTAGRVTTGGEKHHSFRKDFWHNDSSIFMKVVLHNGTALQLLEEGYY